MLKIVLTGGIASGKSTVAQFFRDFGCTIIDADAIAHQLAEPGKPGFIGIVEAFGEVVLDENGRLDRRKMRSIVFSDNQKRTQLNTVMHPLVRQEMMAQYDLFLRQNPGCVVIFDIPLVIETGLYKQMDLIILAWVPTEVQKSRLILRDSLEDEEADNALTAQMNLDEKRKFAHYIIDNSGPLAHTREQTEEVYQKLKALLTT